MPLKVEKLSLEIAALDLQAFMREALAEAEAAGLAGELPFGSVVVVDGVVVGRGQAAQQQWKSQVRHAEMNALLSAGVRLWRGHERAILFSTLEPCPMCLGAAVMADIPHIVFASHDEVAGAGSRDIVAHTAYVARHLKSYVGGILEAEARAVIGRFRPDVLAYITDAR